MDKIVREVWCPFGYGVNPAYPAHVARILDVGLTVSYTPPTGALLDDLTIRGTRTTITNAVVLRAKNIDFGRLRVDVQQQGPMVWPNQGALIVSNTVLHHPTLPVLRPAHETCVRNPLGPVVIGFSNKPQLEWGYRYGILFAKQLGVKVALWHTTWSKRGCTSEDARDHMHEGARSIADDARAFANEHGVPCELVVVRAVDVVGSLHQFALMEHAVCIVVQKVSNVIAGGYDDELRRRSFVPVLTLPETSFLEGVTQ